MGKTKCLAVFIIISEAMNEDLSVEGSATMIYKDLGYNRYDLIIGIESFASLKPLYHSGNSLFPIGSLLKL